MTNNNKLHFQNFLSFVIIFSHIFLLMTESYALTEEELSKLPDEQVKKLSAIELMKGIGMTEALCYFLLENILLDLRYYYKERVLSARLHKFGRFQ
jgi:hypothetical protein